MSRRIPIQAECSAGVNLLLSQRLSAGCWKLFLYLRANLVEPRLAAFQALAIVSKVAFQLIDASTSGFKLLRHHLCGFERLPRILIGRICRPLQKIQDRLPSLIDRFEAIITRVHTAS